MRIKYKLKRNFLIIKLLVSIFLIISTTSCNDSKISDKKNNRVDNLRILTTRENTTEYQKRNKSKSSKYIGVSKDPESDCWKAIIYTEKRNKYIGRFKTEIEASEAYQKELSIISTG